MFKLINSIPNKIIAIGAVLAIVIITLIGIDYYQKFQQVEGLSDGELLKVSKDQIIDYQIINTDGNPSAETSQINDIVKYHYVSNQEIPMQTHNGLKEDLTKRTNNSITFLESVTPINDKFQKEKYVSQFYSGKTFQKSGDKWYQIKTATTTKTAFLKQIKLTALDHVKEFFGQKVLADDFYSGAGDGNTLGSGLAWSVAHDSDGTMGGLANYDNSTTRVLTGYLTIMMDQYLIERAFIPFDTSAIPSNANIGSVTLRIYIASKANDDNDGYDYINIVQTNQSSSATLVGTDFDNCGAISNPATGADLIDITGITVETTTTFTFNPTGQSWIAKNGVASNCGTIAGVTCLGLREGHDITNNPTDDTSGIRNFVEFSTSEDIDVNKKPKLTVNYNTIAPTKVIIDGGTIRIDGGTLKID